MAVLLPPLSHSATPSNPISAQLGMLLQPEIAGFLVALYRGAPKSKAEARIQLRRRWRGLFAFCELEAARRAFDEVRIPAGVDERAVEAAAIWPLIVLSSWVITFCEDLFREALRYLASRTWEGRANKEYEGEGQQYTLLPLILLKSPLSTLLHLLTAVREAQLQLDYNVRRANGGSAFLVTANKELASIMDAVPFRIDDAIGIIQLVENNAGSLLADPNAAPLLAILFTTQSLSSPSYPNLLAPHLVKAATLLTSHPILQEPSVKTRLLIPATDLLDIPLVVRAASDVSFAERDVVSKVPLLRTTGASSTGPYGPNSMSMASTYGLRICARCGSRAEFRWLNRYTSSLGQLGLRAHGHGSGHSYHDRLGMGGVNVDFGAGLLGLSPQWSAYVSEWQGGCVCGGGWLKESA
ncbi:hypothetical protein DL93DRAFT_933606 [Clavulina sp. PMI_390]|nr:hypothetical protein DL93DRAFT_933606 [Clavulina sp. PMI_390]